MRVYCDTSALVAAYVSEALTPQVVARLAKPDTLCVSWLTRVEFCSALALKTRTGDLDKAAARRVLAMFRRHLDTNAYEVLPLGQEAHDLAAGFLAAFATALRALDALHLACCQRFDLALVTADAGLARAAEHFGVSCEYLSVAAG